MKMNVNITESRNNSEVRLESIEKTETLIVPSNKIEGLPVTVSVRTGEGSLLPEPSSEWMVAKHSATPPPPPPPKNHRVVIYSEHAKNRPALLCPSVSSTYCSPYQKPVGEKKCTKSKTKRQKSRPCLTVELSKAKSGAEVLRISLQELGWRWREVCGARKTLCDLHWHGTSFNDNENIEAGMVNKFPGLLELVRKAQLSKLLHQMHELFPAEYDFYPPTWLLPDQFHHFCAHVAEVQQQHPHCKPVYIVKPDEGSQGDGIYLITSPHQVGAVGLVRRAVVQEYIARPLLLECTKFDLRVYVVLVSIQPLQVHICHEGMARFCTMKYQPPSTRNIHKIFMHLTNYSLNKKNDAFIRTDSTDRGSKRTMSSTLAALAARGYDTVGLWAAIGAIVVKTITAMLPDLIVELESEMPSRKPAPSCFQILGFDILITESLKPILLEVNANPSLRLDYEHEVSQGIFESQPSPVDEEIKIPLVKDLLKLLRPRFGRFGKEAKSRPTQTTLFGDPAVQFHSSIPSTYNRQHDEEEIGLETANENSCLEEIWPRQFGERYGHLRVMEQVATLFNHFLGIKGAHRMGATGFRMFSRKCKLCTNGTTMAGIDIMYIDITRRWNLDFPEGTGAGMCFGAFLEAFFVLAKRKFGGGALVEKVCALVDLCECNLKKAAVLGARRTAPPMAMQGGNNRRLCRPKMIRQAVIARRLDTDD